MKGLKVSFKRGNAPIDIAVVFIVLVVFSILSIYGYMVFTEVNDDIQADADISPKAKALTDSLHTKYVPTIDGIAMFSMVLLIIFLVVSVFFLDTHPIFFIVTIILLFASILALMEVANAYDDIMKDADIAPYANQFVYIGWIMRNLVTIALSTGFLVSIAMFIKFKT